MYAFTENSTITIELEGGDAPSIQEVVVTIANGDVTFGELLNEGWPVHLGNSYAQYEFTAYINGDLREFAYGPIEHDELVLKGIVTLHPEPTYELVPEVRAEVAA